MCRVSDLHTLNPQWEFTHYGNSGGSGPRWQPRMRLPRARATLHNLDNTPTPQAPVLAPARYNQQHQATQWVFLNCECQDNGGER